MNAETTSGIYNHTPPCVETYKRSRWLTVDRDVTHADVRRQRLDLMPGFRLTWQYSGMEVEPWEKFNDDWDTKAFVRLDSILNATLMANLQINIGNY